MPHQGSIFTTSSSTTNTTFTWGPGGLSGLSSRAKEPRMLPIESLRILGNRELIEDLDLFKKKRLKLGDSRLLDLFNALENLPERYGTYATYTYALTIFNGRDAGAILEHYGSRRKYLQNLVDQQYKELEQVHGSLLEVIRVQAKRVHSLRS